MGGRQWDREGRWTIKGTLSRMLPPLAAGPNAMASAFPTPSGISSTKLLRAIFAGRPVCGQESPERQTQAVQGPSCSLGCGAVHADQQKRWPGQSEGVLHGSSLRCATISVPTNSTWVCFYLNRNSTRGRKHAHRSASHELLWDGEQRGALSA